MVQPSPNVGRAGDFSFARSLVVQHRCRDVLATCYDPKAKLCEKYPQVEDHLKDILTGFSGRKGTDEQEEKLNRKEHNDTDTLSTPGNSDPKQKHRGPKVLFSVDARKLGLPTGGGKDIRTGFPRPEPKRPAWHKHNNQSSSTPKGGPWDLICFNFPHVGGLSTDVNRQVRANQELLVAFFKACVPLLSLPPEIHDDDEDWEFSDESDSEADEDSEGSAAENVTEQMKSKIRTEPGQILVTMFEGEPYTLWNIRDLARHAGLRVVTSFKFPWASYQKYSHARTLGEVEGKHGGRGGWRGEDREARMYVFEVKQDDGHGVTRNNRNSKTGVSAKKRPRNESDSEDSD
ncbi:hypothetical protein AWENTII_003902 [Aspergillus wentii]|nr:hypothetical protein MW887_006987 [Aspergillus wentii]